MFDNSRHETFLSVFATFLTNLDKKPTSLMNRFWFSDMCVPLLLLQTQHFVCFETELMKATRVKSRTDDLVMIYYYFCRDAESCII